MKRQYRRLSISDLSMVLEMNRHFRDGFVCEENAREFLQNRTNWLFACIENGRIIGFSYGYELTRLNEIGSMLYIHEVGVLPEFWRQGIGKTMLSHLKTLCELEGFCRFFLIAQKSNIPACALYRSAGGFSAHQDDVLFVFETPLQK